MILDADMAVAPEDLPRFVAPLKEGVAELVDGTRLVYPVEVRRCPWLAGSATRPSASSQLASAARSKRAVRRACADYFVVVEPRVTVSERSSADACRGSFAAMRETLRQ